MTFDQFLASTKADAATVDKALRLHLSEVIDDLTPGAMRDELRAAVINHRLRGKEEHLARDSAAIEKAALAYFGELWTDAQQQPSIRASFSHANTRLSGVDSALIAMYAAYLAAVSCELVAVCAGPNGSVRHYPEGADIL